MLNEGRKERTEFYKRRQHVLGFFFFFFAVRPCDLVPLLWQRKGIISLYCLQLVWYVISRERFHAIGSMVDFVSPERPGRGGDGFNVLDINDSSQPLQSPLLPAYRCKNPLSDAGISSSDSVESIKKHPPACLFDSFVCPVIHDHTHLYLSSLPGSRNARGKKKNSNIL